MYVCAISLLSFFTFTYLLIINNEEDTAENITELNEKIRKELKK